MALISLYIRMRLRQAFSPSQNTWGFVILLGCILLGLFYGWSTAAFLDGTFMPVDALFVSGFKKVLLLALVCITFLRGYFPSYKPLQSWFKIFHPVGPVQRFILNYCNDLLATYFFSVACCIILLTSLSATLDYTFGFQAGFLLIGTHVVRRMLQTVVESRLHFPGWAISLLLLSFAAFGVALLFWYTSADFPLLWSTSLFLTLLATGFILEELTPREGLEVQESSKAGKSFTIDLLWHNRSVRVTLVMAFIFKTAFLSLDVIMYNVKGGHMYGNFAMMWLLASPAIVFTYVFNNAWGYLRHFWLLTDRAAADGKELSFLLMKLSKGPLFLDFIISLIYFSIIQDEMFLAGMSMYVTCTFLFIIMSLYWSSAYPIYIDKPVSMKANTSVLASLTLLLVCWSFLLIFLSAWFYFLVPVYAFAGYWMMQWTWKAYPGKRQKLYLKLFKS